MEHRHVSLSSCTTKEYTDDNYIFEKIKIELRYSSFSAKDGNVKNYEKSDNPVNKCGKNDYSTFTSTYHIDNTR